MNQYDVCDFTCILKLILFVMKYLSSGYLKLFWL
jgi:hypothetical protein